MNQCFAFLSTAERNTFSFTRRFWTAASLFLLCCFAPAVVHGQGTYYVMPTASGLGDGSSWANASSNLRDVLNNSSSGDQVWVAAGTYKPHGSNRNQAFGLKAGVEVYGGFTGSETLLSERDWVSNVTILSGDLSGNDGSNFTNRGDNSYHVLVASGTNDLSVLDGFTIRGGQADNSGEQTKGAGIYIAGGSPILQNLIITDNKATAYGGGVFISGNSTANITDVVFTGNTSADGGGLAIVAGSAAVASPVILNTQFIGNSASDRGGAVFNNSDSGTANGQFINTLFRQNTALFGGAIANVSLVNGSANAVFTNVVVYDNAAANWGGGVYNQDAFGFEADPVVQNSILYGNSAGSGGAQFYLHSGFPTFSHSLIAGSGGSSSWDGNLGNDGGNNLDEDPLFTDAVNGDLTLASGSPAINAGDNAADLDGAGAGISTIFDIPKDLAGNSRIDGASIDLGPYEKELSSVDFDFGDAPAPYPTLLLEDGARHVIPGIGPSLVLGKLIDIDGDGQPDDDAGKVAGGDDGVDLDDEDGVLSFNNMISFTAAATIGWVELEVTGGSGYLNAWIDFNNDGDWDDPLEKIFDDEPVSPITQSLLFTIKANTETNSPVFTRFRLSSTPGLSYDGQAADGEVEDYQVQFASGDGLPVTISLVEELGDATVKRDGVNFEVWQGGFLIFSAPINLLTKSVTIVGTEDADLLTIDFAGGSPIPDEGLLFNGRGPTNSPGDALTLLNGAFTTGTHNFDTEHSGTIQLDALGLISYAELEPISDLLVVANRIFNFGAGAQNILLQDDGSSNNGYSFIDSDASESVTFTNPANSLTINAGDGDDVVTVNRLDNNFEADLTVNGQDGLDNISINDAYRAGNRAVLTVNGGLDDDAISVLASSLPRREAHALNGNDGADVFNLSFDPGDEIPIHTGSGLTIDGGDPNYLLAPRDVLNLFANEVGDGGRIIRLAYNSDSVSDVTIEGLGTENGIDVLNVEKINYAGDAANDDDARVTYTNNLDIVTVEPTSMNAADLYLNGSPFDTSGPRPYPLDKPGVKDGEPGPDLSFSGLLPVAGLTLKGEEPATVPGDELYYHGSGHVDVTGQASGTIIGAGVLNVDFIGFENHYTSGLAYIYATANTHADDFTPDVFTVRLLDNSAPLEVVIDVNGTIRYKHLLEDAGTIRIDGSGDDDRLIVDMVNGNPIPINGLFFYGMGEISGDDMVLNNGTFDLITHAFANANDGTITLEDADEYLISYTGLEPIADNLGAADRVFDFSGADDVVSVTEIGGLGVISSSGPTSETVTYVHPTVSLTINGNDGNDDITVDAMPGFAANPINVTVNGGSGDDVVSVTGTSGTGDYAVNGDDGEDTINTFRTVATAIDSYTLNGGIDNDRFNVEPEDAVEIVIDGGDPTFPTFPGDVLDVDLTGVVGDDVTMTPDGSGNGQWTFTNREPVTFTSIEGLVDAADLSISKTVDNGTPLVEEKITYTVTVTNDGATGHAFDVLVTDILPPGLLFVSDSGPGDYDENTGIWTVGDIPKGTSATLLLTAQLKASTVIVNTALIDFPAGYVNYPQTDSDSETIVPLEQTTIWRNANREAGTVMSIGYSSATAKNMAGTLFLGTDGGGVFRSVDNGDNWYPMGSGDLGDAFVRKVVVSGDNNSVWAGTYGDGAWRSTDLGETFTQKFTTSMNVVSMAINNYSPLGPGSDGDVFIGTDGDGIFFSKNNGNTWIDLTGNLPNDRILSIHIQQDGGGSGNDRVWVGTYGGGLFHRDYSAGSWTAANGSNANPLSNKIVHAVTVSRMGHVFAGTLGGVFRSTDGGANWTLVEDGKVDQWSPAMAVRSLLTYYDGTTEYIWAGTDGEYIYRALDATGGTVLGAGGTWLQQTGFPALNGTAGLQSNTIYDMFFVDGYLFAATRDKGLHRSTTTGQYWDQVQAEVLNPVIQAMSFSSDGHRLYAGTYGFGILMTDDFDGNTFVNWTRINHGLGNHWVYSLATKQISGTDLLFAGTWGGGVFRSDDDGESWNFSGLPHGIVHDMAVNPSGVLFAATDNGIIARTQDNGLSWQQIGVATTSIWSIGIDPADSDRMFAGTAGAGVYQTFDGGFTWVHSGLTDRHVFSIAFDEATSPATIYVGTATGVLRSFDQGATWSDLSTGLTVPETRTLAVIAGTPGQPLLTAGTWGGGVFTYNWTVNSWIRDGLGQAPIVAFAINDRTRDGFISTNEGGLYRRLFPAPKTATSAGQEEREMPTEFTLGQNFPNPFNPQTMIEFALPESGHVRLAVFDALGRQVATLADGRMSAGQHEVTFEANSLPSGTYFYQLQAGGKVFSRKMVLMK